MEEITRTLPEDKVYELEVENPYQYYQDDPYGLYRQYLNYDFEWKPDEDAWEKYDNACRKAEEESPKEPEFDEIPCDYCKNFDCMNCKYINGF
jgi:hypothetical protein